MASNTNFDDFSVYNHHIVPITVIVVLSNSDNTITIEDIQSEEYKTIQIPKNTYTRYSLVVVFDKNKRTKISERFMNREEESKLRFLHCGLVYGYNDTTISSEITHSPLGSSVSKLFLHNQSAQDIKLTSSEGNNNIHILSNNPTVVLYRGMWGNGIPLGTTFKDMNCIYSDYIVTKPITDLVYGTINTTYIPSYQGSIYTGENVQNQSKTFHPLSELQHYQFHKGVLIDNHYIPKNW